MDEMKGTGGEGATPEYPGEIGERAEDLAEAYFVSKGYEVRERNWKSQQSLGELDLVVEDAEYLVFVEVRSRTYDAYGTPEETVDPGKRRRVTMTAVEYLALYDIRDRPVRFDVLTVRDTVRGVRLQHFENAFEPALGGEVVLV